MSKIKELWKNKKIAVILSITFSIIVLACGTYAFFNGSLFNRGMDLANTDIENLIDYRDNMSDMQQNLIPTSLENLEIAYKKQSERCIDDNNYSACSIYQFSVDNLSNIGQEIKISMYPTANSFGNLYYRLYEVKSDNKVKLVEDTKLEYNDVTSKELIKNVLIKAKKTRTYELLFYIKDIGIDQTEEDANKKFGAGIRIDSIATGQYIAKQFGSDCWNVEEIETEEGAPKEFKTTAFMSLKNNGQVREECTGYATYNEEDDSYSVTIPHVVGGKEITTVGNSTLTAIEGIDQTTDEWVLNNNKKIKNIIIEEGITTIGEEDDIESSSGTSGSGSGSSGSSGGSSSGYSSSNYNSGSIAYLPKTNNIKLMEYSSSDYSSSYSSSSYSSYDGPTDDSTSGFVSRTSPFGMIGYDWVFDERKNGFLEKPLNEDGVTVKLPKTISKISPIAFKATYVTKLKLSEGMKNIPNYAFKNLFIKEIVIPSTVIEIGWGAFGNNKNLTRVEFKKNSREENDLTIIGRGAFQNCDLTYDESDPLVIPEGVSSIGTDALMHNRNLLYIKYLGTNTLLNVWYDDRITTLLTE